MSDWDPRKHPRAPKGSAQGGQFVSVSISPSILDEYIGRAVFVEGDESGQLPKMKAGSQVVPRKLAEAMLHDAIFNADAKRGPEYMPAGVRRAYGALAKQLKDKLK